MLSQEPASQPPEFNSGLQGGATFMDISLRAKSER
jgi:hypothetical protein